MAESVIQFILLSCQNSGPSVLDSGLLAWTVVRSAATRIVNAPAQEHSRGRSPDLTFLSLTAGCFCTYGCKERASYRRGP